MTSQCERVLSVLGDGRWHSVSGIHRKAGTMRLNSRISELRSRGHEIECERRKGTGPRAFFYRWTNIPDEYRAREPRMPDPGMPSTPATRMRIYTRVGGDLRCIAACADAESLGVALVTLAADGEFDGKLVGVMDRPDADEPGRWLFRPFAPWGAE